MATTIQSTNLDFDDIKSRLKTYLQAQTEFADYDFDASGLSNILDVLAYNTHINGLIANFALNESFLNTSQLRSSAVSHAEVLGYTPRSKTAAQSTVNLSMAVTDDGRPDTITLPAYTTSFTTSIEGVTYTFRTIEDVTATDDGSGGYSFLSSLGSANIQLYEGTRRTKTFIVGETTEDQVYVIPDDTIDTTTLKIDVYDTVSSSTFTTYSNINNVVRIDSTSTVYQIKEVPNGYYEVIFGDGSVLGRQPSTGNKIVITYIASSAADANGGSSFSASSQVAVSGLGNYPLSVTTVSASAGGDDKESISSIKRNATIAFASQQRMVTAEDYKAQILANYSSYVTDVSAWGGNENQPPEYGKVFVSLNFVSGLTDETKQSVKDSIVTNLTNNLAIMSIDTKFSDPTTVFLEVVTTFNFDPDLSSLSKRAIESQVTNAVNTHFTNNLKEFNKVFRRSSMLKDVDNTSVAVLDSKADVKVQLRFTPTLGTALNYSLYFPMAIATPDDVNHRVTSSTFTYDGRTCLIRNLLNSNDLQIQTQTGTVIETNIGSYDATTGTVTLVAFNPTALPSGTQIKVSVVPADESTIRPLRNYIIDIDTAASTSIALFDYQNTSTTLA